MVALSASNDSASSSEVLARLRLLASPIFYLSRNLISFIGVVLATSIFLTMAVFFLADFYGSGANPYTGIVAYLILPGFFLLGLILIPIGMAVKHHREVQGKRLPEKYPQIDFNRPELRRVFNFVVLATGLNGLVLINASYRGVEYMDSVAFCGQVCHAVMQPEFTAYENSPHARVECVRCHIGPGASWFVRSKLSGVRQVFAVALNTYSRPIPTPIEDLRPARETCEQCHWPSKFSGSLLAIRPRFAADEKNTATKTVLLLKVGGGAAQSAGIHSAHLDLAREITYLATDPQRQQIPWVRYQSTGGAETEYAVPDWDGNRSQGELRIMDCMDCHNRPTHAFQLPEQALDDALASGRVAPSLPFVKKRAAEILQQPYPTQAAGAAGVYQALLAYYQESYPAVWASQRESVEQAARAVEDIYKRNVFPEMNVNWGTYPNNIGHSSFPGCFRCHDGNHTSPEGASIPQDCATCHLLLAVEEENPPILEQLTVLNPQGAGEPARGTPVVSGFFRLPENPAALASLRKPREAPTK